ncbi:MAG: hypothetical protein IT258_07130, partial [Saprospiraceae bacterium]|nr:hypothetical protein [Saprospiraceae bacterium]
EPTNPINLELDADFDELKMWAMVLGGTPPYQYLWSTGATTDTIYNLQPNTFYEVTVTDGKGCTSVEHFYIISGTDNLQEKYAFNISPNPVSTELRANFHLPAAAEVSIALFDAMGRQIQTILPNQRLEAGEQRFKIASESWPSGVFSVVINVDGQPLAHRVLKL